MPPLRDQDVVPHCVAFREALRAARWSRPTTYVFFHGLSHMYKPVPPGTSPMEMFGLAGPTDPRVAGAIDSFVRTL
jgi:hypothetical protein